MNKLIVGVSGASGAIYGIRLLQILKELNIETHLIISKSANITISTETDYKISQIKEMADYSYNIDDIAACISSGSFITSGMVILPCSVKTMSEIAHGITPNLLSRSADVILKEKRPLILGLRETPLHMGHLQSMLQLSQMGAIIYPPVPAFYIKPKNIDELIDHTIYRILDLLNIDTKYLNRWNGI